MQLGCHVGVSGGVENAPPRAAEIKAACMQIFSKNQRQWQVKPLSAASIDGFRQGVARNGLGPTLIHCSYLLNLASPDEAMWEKSVLGLAVELERADQLGVPYITFHPGSPKDAGRDFGVKRVAEGVSKALELTAGGQAMVLLETNAGQGNQVGRTFDELAAMMAGVTHDKHRVGVCFDTCHVFVSGYPLHTAEGYQDTFDTFDNEVGLEHLKAFHLNDSLVAFDSKRDRHANIGEGHIGLEPFRWLVNDKRFAALPGYLETPVESEADYAKELALLRSLQT